jgi:catechol 2,3-dioxygenase-like lactoylglutathione lyase family enzyme
MIQRLSHSSVWVLDQDEAKAFYTEKLGFEVRNDQRMGNFRWLTVGPKGQPDVEIILAQVGMGPTRDPELQALMPKMVKAGMFGTGVYETDNCRQTYEELKARGVEMPGPPAERPYGIELTGRDNSGNWFVIVERPRR